MNFKYFKNRLDTSKAQAWTTRIIIIFLCIIVIYQMVVISRLTNDAKTIILPPRVKKAFYVTGSHISKGYAIDMGQYLSQTLLDVSSGDYKTQLGLFLQFVSPSEYNGMELTLLKQFKALAKLQVSQSFFPKRISVKKNDIYVTGSLMWYMGNNHVKVFQKTLIIKYIVENGEFYVKAISFKKNKV